VGILARFESLQRTIQIPDGVTVEVEGKTVRVKGPRGTLEEDLSHLPVGIAQSGREVQVSVSWPRKREIGMLGTGAAHIRNMIRGVTKGYRYNLRTVYAHFPVTVKVDEKARALRVENFTGEKTPRSAEILEGVKVAVKGDDITVEGIDLNAVGQTAANIQNSKKIKKKDLRVFLDGIYIDTKTSLETPAGPAKVK
jgi:large subunit ribosomal protein L6